MTHFFDLSQIISSYGYLGIFIIVFLESSLIFPLPGDSLLFTAGLFAAAFGLNIYLLIFVSFLATFLGGVAGYEIGINLLKLEKYSFFRGILKPEYLGKAHNFFEKHGRVAITFARFVPVVRTFISIVAGVARMDYISFAKYSLLGSALWSATATLLGYFLGRVFPQIKDYMWVVIVLVVIVSIMPLAWEWMQGRQEPPKV